MSVRVGFVVDEVALGQVFLRVLLIFSCQYHSTDSSCPPVHLSLTRLPRLEVSPLLPRLSFRMFVL
jgi:hypothetical protein